MATMQIHLDATAYMRVEIIFKIQFIAFYSSRPTTYKKFVKKISDILVKLKSTNSHVNQQQLRQTIPSITH